MFAVRNLSIKGKLTLIVMTASATAVLLACLASYVLLVNHYRQWYRNDLASLASVLGHNCQAALAFHVPEDADKVLASLSARPSIAVADLRDAQGNDFALFRNSQPAASDSTVTRANGQPAKDPGHYLVVSQTITLGDEVLGTISLYDDMRHLAAVRWLLLFSLFAVMLVVLGIALFVASRLQGLIVKPISELASISQRVTASQDYSVRAKKFGNDELGHLVDAFNDMLSEIERQDSALRESERQFLQAQKMEAIGRLSGGVAHDFNNLLTTILGYSEMLLLDLPDDSRIKSWITAISEAGKRAADLTRQLLAFSRKQVLEMRVVDLNTVIDSIAKILRRLIGEDVQITFHIQSASAPVLADPVQIEQVLMNLVVNARDAMPHGGRLTIETTTVHLDADYAHSHRDVAVGTYLLLSVADTGVGMTPEVRERIFEPFFTTKEKGKGTGLGLATIYGIVRQHKGHIYVYSEPGQGTVFKIYFPKAKEPAAEEPPAPAWEMMPRGTETILVVDDEAAIRQVVVDTLLPLGYKVFNAASGEAALELVSSTDNRIDLLLTDVVMTGMNGRQLVEALRLLRPDMKVIFMSGYTDDVIAHQGILESGTQLLNKPIIPSKLATRLRKVLDSEGKSSGFRNPVA